MRGTKQAIKGLTIKAALIGLSLALAGCSHHKSVFKPNMPLPQSQQKYIAPAQTYILDLSSAALVGHLDLQTSCAPEGNSLVINDQLGRHYRIDVINLNNNPKFPDSQNSSLKDLTEQVYQSYITHYQALPQGETRLVRSPIGGAGYRLLYLHSNHLYPVGLLITRRGDYAYVLQHVQPYLNQQQMQFNLVELAKNMKIPGRQLKDSGSEMPISIDLAQSTPAQLATWQKTTHCS